MSIKILQTKDASKIIDRTTANSVEVTLDTGRRGRKSAHAYIKVYFGANVTRANYYTLGSDGGKPVLVPSNNEQGYKVGRVAGTTAGLMRFDLWDSSLDAFGAEVADALRHDLQAHIELKRRFDAGEDTDDIHFNGGWVFTAHVDKEQRVWIDADLEE